MFVANLHDKTKCIKYITTLKQVSNHGLVLKKVQKVIKFNQNAWLKPYIDMNTNLKKKSKNDFEKAFLNLMNNAVFGKTIENVRKHRDMKLVKTKRRRKFIVWEPNYHTIILMYQFWYNNVKLKYGLKAKLLYGYI